MYPAHYTHSGIQCRSITRAGVAKAYLGVGVDDHLVTGVEPHEVDEPARDVAAQAQKNRFQVESTVTSFSPSKFGNLKPGGAFMLQARVKLAPPYSDVGHLVVRLLVRHPLVVGRELRGS